MIADGPIRVFISYSHDSAEHAQRVLDLCGRLRTDGIDCHIDQYEFSPPEGWPRWMQNHIGEARFVLVISTEVYARRAEGKELAGVGLGATWEGAIITQELYERGGRNEKFIPVVFASADVKHVPKFVSGATRYDLSLPDGYELLYRHLTNQPRAPKPELGSVRFLDRISSEDRPPQRPQAPSRDLTNLVLLMSLGGHGTFVIASEKVEQTDRVVLMLKPADSRESAFLHTIKNNRSDKLGVAFGLNAFLGLPQTLSVRTSAAIEEWEIVIAPEVTDYGAGFMEMSFGNYSADDIAELRAKRILLNEPLPKQSNSSLITLGDETLEVAVRAFRSPLQVVGSPLPDLFKDVGRDRDYFVAAARLIAALWLKLSGTVEYVHSLDFRFEKESALFVRFEGQRAKRFSNVEPTILRVEGVCNLGNATGNLRKR